MCQDSKLSAHDDRSQIGLAHLSILNLAIDRIQRQYTFKRSWSFYWRMFAEKRLGCVQLCFRRRDRMQASNGILFILPLLLALSCGVPSPAPELTVELVDTLPTTDCVPSGNIRFICDLISPEDLAVIPGEEWVRNGEPCQQRLVRRLL